MHLRHQSICSHLHAVAPHEVSTASRNIDCLTKYQLNVYTADAFNHGKAAIMEKNARLPFRRGSAWRRAILAVPVFAMLANGGPANANDGAFDWTGTYAGVFAGAGRADGRIVDTDGFSYSGNSGWTVDYDDTGLAGGALIGRKLEIGGVPFRIEFDATFGDLSAKTDRIDPRFQPPDETVESKFQWVTTARAGVEQAVGPATLFASGGLALARIENSLRDLDAYRDRNGEWVLLPNGRPAQRMDPDDSFRDGSTEFGWVIGVGIEASLNDAWTLRLEGSYMDFGESTHHANRSGDDRCCGAGSPRRPVSYRIENRLGIVRLGVIYRFGS